jgi:hypothetical protein
MVNASVAASMGRMAEPSRTSTMQHTMDTPFLMRMIGTGRRTRLGSQRDRWVQENKMPVKSLDSVVHVADYFSGWLDSSVPDFLDLFPLDSPNINYALITSLDSDRKPAKLLERNPDLSRLLDGTSLRDGALLVPARLLKSSETRDQIFFGFDEVWFFPEKVVEPKPKGAWIVGPDRIGQSTLDRLGTWMNQNRCMLALGDGNGLNFIVKARGMMKYLIALSMSQRTPNIESDREFVVDEV